MTLRRRFLFYASPERRDSGFPEERPIATRDQRVCVVLGPAFAGSTERSRVRFEDGFEAEVADSELIECGGHASW